MRRRTSRTSEACCSLTRRSGPERLENPYFRGELPASLLIEEVEALWDRIADADDWSSFIHMDRIEAGAAGPFAVAVNHA